MDLHSAGLKREDVTKMHEGKGQFRILVVEDEAKVAGALREGLEREKYDVVVAPTGEEGFFLVNAEDFDLVLLDLMLPGRDGLQVLSTLRKRGLQTPVLILTARDAIEDRVEGLDKGADDYLVKPFTANELKARVGTHLQMALTRRRAIERESSLRAEAEAARDEVFNVLEGITDGFLALDENWRITYVNGEAEKLNGL